MKKVVPTDAILIPKEAKLVFKGEIFDVLQWPQELYDGTTKTFEMLRRPDTVEIIVVKDQQILLVRDEQPNRGVRLKLPMGRVEANEAWEAAAKRELREETGLECADWTLVMVRQPVSKIEWFGITFVVSDIRSQGDQTLDAGEKIELEWRDYSKVRQAVLDDKEPGLAYNLSIFKGAETVGDLLQLPVFQGKEVEV